MARELKIDWEYLELRLEGALNECLTRDAIDDAIVKHAQAAIEDAIAEEIMIFYRVGDGRRIVADAVMKRLNLHGGESP